MEGVASFDPEALAALRRRRGLSHDALGRLVGQTRNNLIAWEKGRVLPSPANLVRLAAALEVDPLELTTVTLRTATLADLRARAGLSRPTVAAALGIGRSSYDRYERGRGPRELPAGIAAQLAELLAVHPRTLVAAYRRAAGELVDHAAARSAAAPPATS